MTIVGCFIFPHGAITLDPLTRNFDGIPAVRPTSKEECIKLHEAMVANAKSLVDLRPDLIILSTPHGLNLQKNFLFVGNSVVKGDAQWDGDWTDFTAEFSIDSQNSASLVKYLRDGGNAVELLSIGEVTDPLPLRWAEVIPWWFINNAAESAGYQLPPVILLGHPSRHYADTEIMIPELINLGENIFEWTESDDYLSNRNIAVVISSDLSHYHSADPTSPYPYSEFAPVFDGFVSEWAGIEMNSSTEKKSSEKLVSRAGTLVNRIGTCGYTGLVTVHGLLKKAVQKCLEYPATMIYYAAPTYFVYQRAQNHLKTLNQSSDLITENDVKLFCREAATISLVRGTKIADEYEKCSQNTHSIASELEMPSSLMEYYVVLRAVDRFQSEHGGVPGECHIEADTARIKSIANKLLADWGVTHPFSAELAHEICRYGDTEIHSVSAFMGGCVAQEVIKLITQQYQPVNNTLIYSAITSSTATFQM